MFDLFLLNSSHPELVNDISEILAANKNNKVLLGVYKANLYQGNKYGFTEIGMRSYDFMKAFGNAYYDEHDVMCESDLNILEINEVWRDNKFDLKAVCNFIRERNKDYPAASIRLYQVQFSNSNTIIGHAQITDII